MIDVETTGLFPGRHDRVIEVGVIVTGAGGQELSRYETLVNPGRDLGPTDIHGIRGRDVEDAPTFSEIVGDLCECLGDRVLAAHNARFDRGFLAAEFDRCGFNLPEAPWLCTMELGGEITGQMKLSSCCEELGFDLRNAHCAADDAAAAAAILAHWLQLPGAATELKSLLEATPIPAEQAWPVCAPSGRSQLRTSGRPTRTPNFISSLITQLPPGRHGGTGATAAYIDLLDRALEDRLVSEDEAEALHELAVDWGLGQDDVGVIHEDYLRALAALAWQDGRLTPGERADLEDTAAALGLNLELLADVLAAPVSSSASDSEALPRQRLAGRSVCFTGQLSCTINRAPITREKAEEFAASRGMVIRSGVTKDLDLLVVADPDSLSGKARKARAYGTRIVVERAFWRDIGVRVD